MINVYIYIYIIFNVCLYYLMNTVFSLLVSSTGVSSTGAPRLVRLVHGPGDLSFRLDGWWENRK